MPFNTRTYVYYMKYKNKISAQNAKNGASWLKQHLKNASCN